MNKSVRFWLPLVSPFLIAAAAAGIIRSLYPVGPFSTAQGPQLLSISPSPNYSCTARTGDTIVTAFTVKNIQTQPITLLGATSGCSCTVTQGLPLKLNSGESGTVFLKVTIGLFDETGKFSRSSQILTNRDGMVPPLVLEATTLEAPHIP